MTAKLANRATRFSEQVSPASSRSSAARQLIVQQSMRGMQLAVSIHFAAIRPCLLNQISLPHIDHRKLGTVSLPLIKTAFQLPGSE
jgi:hypothetical protein